MRSKFFALLLLTPALVHAHPGHGASNGHDFLHYLLSPEHTGPAILLLVAVSLFLMLRNPAKARERQPKS